VYLIHGSISRYYAVREWTRCMARTIIMRVRYRQENWMRATRIMANLRVADVDAAKRF
jgi:hypothetical protein